MEKLQNDKATQVGVAIALVTVVAGAAFLYFMNRKKSACASGSMFCILWVDVIAVSVGFSNLWRLGEVCVGYVVFLSLFCAHLRLVSMYFFFSQPFSFQRSG